jgi:DNA-directed RNA polymerase alpha subunit
MSSEEGEEIVLEDYPQVRFQVINDENGEGCAFTLKDFQLKDVARLRQIMYRSLEVMAIETVEIIDNTTDFINESIASRLGLIPIRCEGIEDIPVIENTEDLEDEIQDGVGFTMDVDKPETSRGKTYVTEKDIVFEDDRCRTVTQGTPIFFLRPGQRFELVGKVQKGLGSMHVKWIPVAAVVYERPNEDEYILKIVTKGQLTCNEIIQEAMDILTEES